MNGLENVSANLYSSVNTKSEKVIVFRYDSTYYAESANTIGNILWLKMVRVNHALSGFFSADGIKWTQVGAVIDITHLDSNPKDYNGWCGNRQGLYVNGKPADFDLYIYRDAYTPILAECPANQFGTSKTSVEKGISSLDDIHNNDWALYAGVEFGGNSNYAKQPENFEVIASSATNGGTIEVWLDAIDTGKKVAACKISNTDSWNTYKTFSVPVGNIKGSHDVYLRFKGADPDKLFRVKWLNFTSK
jgi:xylan 1,4-beta-xylosidase